MPAVEQRPMPAIDSSSLHEPLAEPLLLPALVVGALALPLLLPAPLAGALTALLVLLAVLMLRQAGAGMPRVVLAAAVPVVVGMVVSAVLDRLAVDARANERHAILARNAELNAQAMAPGSVLACLDDGAGEVVGSSCEKAIFATPQATAAAVSYVGARLVLLMDATDFAKKTDSGLLKALAPARRAIELDRYGIASRVLAGRDGCTADHCPVFASLQDTSTLKTHLREHAFDSYVVRYADTWTKAETVADAPEPPSPQAPANRPVSSGYDFPSAASIPPVSIMNAEPRLPKESALPGGEKPTGSIPEPKEPQKKTPAPPTR